MRPAGDDKYSPPPSKVPPPPDDGHGQRYGMPPPPPRPLPTPISDDGKRWKGGLEQCACPTPDYHRARITHYVGPFRLRTYGRWCARCGELLDDRRGIAGWLVTRWLDIRGESSAYAECIEHEGEAAT